jgi:hypothetical protein
VGKLVFNMDEAIEVLERTPKLLDSFLSGLSDAWLHCNEGEGTWNVSEVIGHLIDGEKYNWIPRLELMLQESENKAFPAFDRFSHLKDASDKTIDEKLVEFKSLRTANIDKLKTMITEERHFELTGVHPEYGEVKVRELISTWAVHDLTHISQITRVMANRYRADVGPWKSYLGILKK